MFLTIDNPPKKISSKLLHRATKFYINKLLSSQLTDKLSIDIKFKEMKKDDGVCHCLSESFPPTEFLIKLASNNSKTNILKTLAHEIGHVMQFVRGSLKERNGVFKWNNKKYTYEQKEILMTPWEIEATGLEITLYDLFIQELRKNL